MPIPNLTILTLNTPNIADFAAARNALLQTAKTDWVLFLDSDEVVTPALMREIKTILQSPRAAYYSAFWLKRQDTFLGRKLRFGETGRARFVRLAKRDWGVWEGRVHETWVGRGFVGTLKNPLLHAPHPSLSSFVDKIDQYSTLAAQERYDAGIKPPFVQILAYPLAKFLDNYFIRLGIFDGVPGLIHALMMSWHSYLTHTKNYLLWQKH